MIGVEGQNPSGHCLVTSKVVDSLPFSAKSDECLPPSKKQAMDEEFEATSCSRESYMVF